jgi:hypothetical protein
MKRGWRLPRSAVSSLRHGRFAPPRTRAAWAARGRGAAEIGLCYPGDGGRAGKPVHIGAFGDQQLQQRGIAPGAAMQGGRPCRSHSASSGLACGRRWASCGGGPIVLVERQLQRVGGAGPRWFASAPPSAAARLPRARPMAKNSG